MAKYYYNGVLLPEIPADVLAEYPYAWIRNNDRTGHYDLLMVSSPWYAEDADTIFSDSFSTTGIQWFRITKSTPEESWVFNQAWTSSGGFGNENDRPIMWSNHDIPNGSATATEIYFLGSEPMPEDKHSVRLDYVKSTGYAYLDTGVIPDANTEAEVTYNIEECIMYGCHVLSTGSWYFPFARNYGGANHYFANNLGAELRIDDVSAVGQKHTVKAFPDGKIEVDGITIGNLSAGSKTPTAPLYLLAYGGNPTSMNYKGTCKLYSCKIWQSGKIIREYIPYNQKGVVGLLETVSGNFYTSQGSLAFIAGDVYVEPSPSDRINGYLIQSGNSVFTVTDGVLTAVEGSVNAELFRTYGMDDVPDGVLLATLTDPEVLFWQDSQDELPDISLTVTGTPPLPQVITSDPVDLAHDGSGWYTVTDTEPGMLASTMNAITTAQWAEIATMTSCQVRAWLPTVTSYVDSVVFHYINPYRRKLWP